MFGVSNPSSRQFSFFVNLRLRVFIFVNRLFSFPLAKRRYRVSSCVALNDLVKLIGSSRYRPSSVQTWDMTTYFQFLKRFPFGHDDIIITSLVVPCSLCPVDALLRFTDSCVIRHMNLTSVIAAR